jgi:hypothetical protein
MAGFTDDDRVLNRLPPLLAALVAAELSAGNAVASTGSHHPAPPSGGVVMLAHDLRTPLPTGVSAYARDASTHHMEVTDDQKRYWVLTAPHPPPEIPDMDAIRASRAAHPASPPKRLRLTGTIDMDVRGETLVYREAERRATIVWTWTDGSTLYPSTLSGWHSADPRQELPMTDEELEAVLRRFVDFARQHLAADLHIGD